MCATQAQAPPRALARQVLGERLVGGPTPLEPLDLGGSDRRRLGPEFVLGGARGELVELESSSCPRRRSERSERRP